MADNKKKKPASLGCLFWIAFILLIIALFFFNRKNISEVLDKTGATHLFSGIKNTVQINGLAPGVTVPEIKIKEEPVTTPPAIGDGSIENKSEPITEKTQTTVTKPEISTKPAPTPKTQIPPVSEPKAPVAKTEPVKTEPAKTIPTRKATLYFVIIDADGGVIRKEVTREIAVTDSPLSETLNTLFKGTNTAEDKKGLRSLIPGGTRLISAIVKDGVATLNMSDEFQFNQYGIEGYLGQLSQIVFTATAFPTVKSVQFLIEGQRHEYLGAEGVWIGTPLSRDKF